MKEDTRAVGVDAGATLTKLAFLNRDRELHLELLPASDGWQATADRIEALSPSTLGLTGGGGVEIAERIFGPSASINEFAAWGTGTRKRGAGFF